MKRVFFIVATVTTFLIVIMGIILMPFFRQKRYTNNLKKEVNMVANYINHDKGKSESINHYIQKNVTDGDLKVMEKAIDNYLSDIVKSYDIYKNINDNNGIDEIIIDFNKEEIVTKLENLNNDRDSLTNLHDIFSNISPDNYFSSKDKKKIQLYKKFVDNKINNASVVEKIDNTLNIVNNKISIMDYLQDNQDFYNIDGKIIFLKRAKFNEFSSLMENNIINIAYELVNDTDGPVINTKNVIITQGEYVDLDNIASCYDEVDGDVICDINGSYNNNAPGTYTLNIRATDGANNETSRDINIIVKEKERYNLPYVIEVLRNQSTTIVYGQDDNGEYTKIVKVFVCSPGAGENTPVGTFYSHKGYVWGGLYGGVYGQYSTIITGHYLFHSVPYYSMSKDSLWWEAYNELGTKVSMGCIRLTVNDAKWIYDNCQTGTMVKIYDGDLPVGVEKPTAQKISASDPYRGWDPTDPDPDNPWNK